MSSKDYIELISSKIPRRKYLRGGEKVCEVCYKQTKSPSDLERHMRIHTGEKPFFCLECKKTFKSKRSQESHQFICHGITHGMSATRIALLSNQQRKQISYQHAENDVSDECTVFCPSVLAKSNTIEENVEFKNTCTSNESCATISKAMKGEMSKHAEELEHLTAKDQSLMLEVNTRITSSLPQGINESNHATVQTEESESDNSLMYGISVGDDTMKKTEKKELGVLEKYHNKFHDDGIAFSGDSAVTLDHPHQTILNPYVCDICHRDFKSAYSLNYHLRAAHGRMVELIPALEMRLAKRKRCRSLTSQHILQSKMNTEISVKHNELQVLPSFSHSNNIIKTVSSSVVSAPTFTYGTGCYNKVNCKDFLDQQNSTDFNHNQTTDIVSGHLTSPYSSSQSFDEDNEKQDRVSGSLQILLPNFLLSGGVMTRDSATVWQTVTIQTETPVASKLEGVHSNTGQRFALYKCCLCGDAFPGLRLLCSHLAVHNQTSKDYDCEKCGAVFKWRSEFDIHQRVHRVTDNRTTPTLTDSSQTRGLASYTDELYDSVTNIASSVSVTDDHIPNIARCSQIATNSDVDLCTSTVTSNSSAEDKKALIPDDSSKAKDPKLVKSVFQCRYCPKSFDRVFSMQRHERIHTGVKPCYCKECGRGFSEKRNLRHHIIRFHSESNQKEILRRGRGKSREKCSNNSLKRVSFLKKAAVRILNSVDQQKIESSITTIGSHGSSDPSQENITCPKSRRYTEPKGSSEQSFICKKETISMCENNNFQSDLNINFIEKTLESFTPNHSILLFDQNKNDGYSNTIQEKSDTPYSSHELNEKELLKDPKRSLIGNRRKKHPLRLLRNQADLKHGSQHIEITSQPKIENYNMTTEADSKQDMKQSSPLESITDVDIRPFKCPYCTYCSRTNSQLKVHMMRHQGIKEHLCRTCNYNGVTRSDLNRHCKTRAHILRAQHICLNCGLGFYSTALLQEHVALFHSYKEALHNNDGHNSSKSQEPKVLTDQT
ncbi:zinc finger protein 585B-like isoform X2 [Limulus polyphemus]|uniref:Zinc finger protein 585B-like isoform X2 n=1 Tax=Limulus polyphemus TaxID=6850 RepID=A0ABM1T9W4_LIMPO|nr:zinc finger protein 585B-like isoform X2 [Limulus polyphemus]